MNPSPVLHLEGAGVTTPGLAGAPARVVLHPLNLAVSEARVAVIGANGQGKTTLLRLAAGLIHPGTGRVVVDGLDWASETKALRSRVGMLFADTAAQLIMPTVIEDVELSLRSRRLPRAQRRQSALQSLASLGVEHLAPRSVYELSGGERQLVALAGLSATSPRLLLADEPTAALDLSNADRVARALLGAESHVLVATHDLDLAARCERVLWMHAGAIVADGAPEEVIAAYVGAVRGTAAWPTRSVGP